MLTGFMGVGKTTIGQSLARKLNREFIDADHEIEKRQRMPITGIFKTMGEPKFREMERDLIVELCRRSGSKVVSLGGGAFLQEEIRDVCLAESIVVHLAMDWECWKRDRLPLLIDTRPLLQQKSPEEIEALFQARRQAYSLSHITVHTDDLTPDKAADAILDQIRPRP